MKKHPVLSVMVAVIFLVMPFAASFGQGTDVSADAALKALKDGNERYIVAKQIHPNAGQDRRTATTVNGQKPIASILSCSDSRVPVEMLFDQGIGDLFVVRVAGNQANLIETASLEFGTAVLGTPFLLVMGHTHCGAVVAAIQTAETKGDAPALLKSIVPAVTEAKKNTPSATGEALVKAATQANVWQAIADLFQSSPTISERVRTGKLKIQGAVYDIETGKVNWMGPHPNQDKLTSSK
ncbi:MAG: carbonic anhydrase [Pseudomonadota bacterium]